MWSAWSALLGEWTAGPVDSPPRGRLADDLKMMEGPSARPQPCAICPTEDGGPSWLGCRGPPRQTRRSCRRHPAHRAAPTARPSNRSDPASSSRLANARAATRRGPASTAPVTREKPGRVLDPIIAELGARVRGRPLDRRGHAHRVLQPRPLRSARTAARLPHVGRTETLGQDIPGTVAREPE